MALVAAGGGALPANAAPAEPQGYSPAAPRGAPPVLDGTLLALRGEALMTVRPDGSNRRLLVTGKTDGAAFSPDGRQVAFAQDGDIFVVASSGGTPRRVVAGPHFSSRPTWSPNGRYLAYASREVSHIHDADHSDIFRVTVAIPAGSVVRLTDDSLDAPSGCGRASGFEGPVGFSAPAWDPKGRFIAAVARCIPDPTDGDASLVYLAPQGNRILRAFWNRPKAGVFEPADVDWAPDGGMVSMTDIGMFDHLGPGRFWVMNVDGSDRRQLVEVPDDEYHGATSPQWSPTGTYLAYHYQERWDSGALWITNLAGTRRWPVARAGGIIPVDWTAYRVPRPAAQRVGGR